MRRKFRSRSSLQTAFNNRKYITRRIRLTISTRPPIPRQLASLARTLSLSPPSISRCPSLSRSFRRHRVKHIYIVTRTHTETMRLPACVLALTSRRVERARQETIYTIGGIPELTSVLRRHARLIHIRDTSAVRATRLQPFIAIRRHVIC